MSTFRHAVIACSLLALTACTTTDPYTGESKASNTAKGSGIGAIAGAALGAIANKKDRRKGALIGAAAGAATGAGVGRYMDVQEAKLREKLAGSGVSVTRNGDDIVLNMPGNITFPTGGFDLNASFFQTLDSVAIVLKEYKQTKVTVSGHTDSRGDQGFNQSLSEKRANSVASYLKSQGVASQRLVAVGYGENAPIAENTSAQGRQQNRRVEILLNPMQTEQ